MFYSALRQNQTICWLVIVLVWFGYITNPAHLSWSQHNFTPNSRLYYLLIHFHLVQCMLHLPPCSPSIFVRLSIYHVHVCALFSLFRFLVRHVLFSSESFLILLSVYYFVYLINWPLSNISTGLVYWLVISIKRCLLYDRLCCHIFLLQSCCCWGKKN